MKEIMRRLPVLHIGLFLVTLFCTLVAGTLQQGINPIENPSLLWKGIPFSFTLLLILGAHEFGHYFMSRKHHIDVTLPYFIPAPSLVGTFGAFIKMKSPIMDRRILLDVGAAGPLAGLCVTVPVLLVGLSLSEVKYETVETGFSLGSSMLFSYNELDSSRLCAGQCQYHSSSHSIFRMDWIAGYLFESAARGPA